MKTVLKKNTLLRITNLVLYLSFCVLIGTGALITWKLVPGSLGGHGLQVLDRTRHEWGNIHFWSGVVCISATGVHMLLNWAWLKKIATSGHHWRLSVGLAVGLILIFGIYSLPLQQQQGGGQNHRGNTSQDVPKY